MIRLFTLPLLAGAATVVLAYDTRLAWVLAAMLLAVGFLVLWFEPRITNKEEVSPLL